LHHGLTFYDPVAVCFCGFREIGFDWRGASDKKRLGHGGNLMLVVMPQALLCRKQDS
jgi:hypothetical protein